MVVGSMYPAGRRRTSRHCGGHVRAVSGGDVRLGMSSKMRERNLILFVVTGLRGRVSKKAAIWDVLDGWKD